MNPSAVQSTSGFFPWLELGDFRIQTYFVVISLVLCVCAFIIPLRAQARGRPAQAALDLFIFAMLGGFFGARLFHIVWEEPAYYLESPLRIFDVLSGGFVWYGGAICGVISMYAWMKFKKGRDFLSWLDFFAPVAAFGYAGGRVACFLTGCCFGRVCELGGHFYRFPSQSFAVLWELAVGFLLLKLERGPTSFRGRIFLIWLGLHGLGRIFMEISRSDPRGPAFGIFTVSLALSLVMVIGAAATYRLKMRTRS